MSQIIRIAPYAYITVEDNNTNVARLVLGPCTYTKGAQESVVSGPTAMVVVPPGHFCVIENPVVRDPSSDADLPLRDAHGVYVCRWGEREVRKNQDPFPLYPGESLHQAVSPLLVIDSASAFRLVANQDFVDEDGTERHATERWLLRGPRAYTPRSEVSVEEAVQAIVIKPNRALRMRALRTFTTAAGVQRIAGEEWLERTVGEFMPAVDEQVVEHVNAFVLTETRGLHLRARAAFTDVYGAVRQCGDEWIVTRAQSATHIVDAAEALVREIQAITLTNTQYCVVLDPYDGDRQRLGAKKLVRGPLTFFLRPGESLLADTQATYTLGSQDALVLQANEAFTEADGTVRAPGHRWMVNGPCEYVPSTAASVIDMRQRIPLASAEGIYVRNLKNGKVRAEMGASYMLREYEQLWEKDLPAAVEALVSGGSPVTDEPVLAASVRATPGMQSQAMARSAAAAPAAAAIARRDKWRVVTYNVPHNSCVQLFDYKTKRSRVVFGPDLVLLQPDEHFTQLNLSGGMPKRSGAIRSLLMFLGPDFMTDVLVVETSDHARLSIQLGYNWHFELDRADEARRAAVFSVPDFVGDACNTLGSRVRAAISSVPFQMFHAHSAEIIRAAVLGDAPDGTYRFPANGLVITNVDVQNVEPVDQRTRDSLQKSVTLAIEITTAAVEAEARNDAKKIEQEAIGTLEKQVIEDDCLIEQVRYRLVELQAEAEAIKTSGQAEAEAKAFAQRAGIEGEAEVDQAKLRTDATNIEASFELERLTAHYDAEVAHQRALNTLEVEKARRLAEIETSKFKSMVTSITPACLLEMARAGPELQAELLKGLGIQGYIVTSGASPVNLLSAAHGLLGSAGMSV